LGKLNELLDSARKRNVIKLCFHPNGMVAEVLMGPPSVAAAVKRDANGKNPQLESRRQHYEALLGHKVTDQFLENLP
jgi:hypothetical protein